MGSRERVWSAVTALVAVAVVVGAAGGAAAGTQTRWAAGAPGLAELPGADACYAQQDEESEGAARCRVAKGLLDPAAAVVAPDGRSVYSAAWGSDAVGVFTRAATGKLVEIACVSNNGTTGVDGTAGQCADGDSMWGAAALAVSPDGRNVYVASYASGGVAEFVRDPVTSRLRQIGCVRPVKTCTGARGLAGAASVAVSPDGANVYVAAAAADAVTAFSRDRSTGLLTGIGCISDDGTDRMCGKGNALRGAVDVAVSPDGKFVYVAATDSSSVLTFARDTATGQLRQTGCVLQDAPKPGSCTRAYGLEGPVSLAFAPDGGTLFVASYYSNSVAVFARNRTTGALSERGCVSEVYEDEKDGCVHTAPLVEASDVAVSPDGLRLYVTSAVGLTVFDRDRKTGGLRPAGCVAYGGWDEEVKKACQLGRGLAGATGVAVSPDGRNVYVTAAGSDALASFATGVGTRVSASLGRRRLTVAVICPAAHESGCSGHVGVADHPSLGRGYALAAGASATVTIRIPASIVRAARRRPLQLLVSASEPGRSPVVRSVTLGTAKPAPKTVPLQAVRGEPEAAARQSFHASFCATGAAASWCRYVQRVRIVRSTLTGVTTLRSVQEARGAAGHICAALSTIAFGADPRLRLTSVRVLGRQGRTLASRPSIAARCPR